jgi:hypothetical protein
LEEHPDLFNMLKTVAAAAASVAIQGVAIVTTITATTTSLVVPVVTNLILPIAIPIITSVGSVTFSIIKYGIRKVYTRVQEPESEDLDLGLDLEEARQSKDLPPAIT